MATGNQTPAWQGPLATTPFVPSITAPFAGFPNIDAFWSITMLSEYQHLSFEEIRLNDYYARKGQVARTSVAHSQTPPNSASSSWKPQTSSAQTPGTGGMLSGYVTAKLGVWSGLGHFSSRRAPFGVN